MAPMKFCQKGRTGCISILEKGNERFLSEASENYCYQWGQNRDEELVAFPIILQHLLCWLRLLRWFMSGINNTEPNGPIKSLKM